MSSLLTNYPANTIYLPIKQKWFDMILSGEKKEEYREIKPYWAKRLTRVEYWLIKHHIREHLSGNNGDLRPPVKYGKTTLTLHYYRKPRLVVELKGVKIKEPNPGWCPPGTTGLWFALQLGEVLRTENC